MNEIKLLRKFIRRSINEISRNYHTVDPSPITFEDFSGYNLEISPGGNMEYIVNITFEGKTLYGPKTFKDYEEAKNSARRIIDSHRVSIMNSN